MKTIIMRVILDPTQRLLVGGEQHVKVARLNLLLVQA